MEYCLECKQRTEWKSLGPLYENGVAICEVWVCSNCRREEKRRPNQSELFKFSIDDSKIYGRKCGMGF